MPNLAEAFLRVCTEAKPASGHFVALVLIRPYYGGPEEGGWWGHDSIPVAYQRFDTAEAAEAAAKAVQEMADRLTKEAAHADSEAMRQSCDWCEARGMDPGELPEPDGAERYRVTVTDEIPTASYGPRHYE